MVRYFIGSVLSPYEVEENAENDPTFGFSREQSDALDLAGLPVQMEHHPEMKVGSILRSWSEKDGSKWVLGKVDGDGGFQSEFAQRALDTNPTTGRAYYKGLSLQHAHIQLASGNNKSARKEGIEVSLVCEPRRADSRIVFVDTDNEPNKTQIKKSQYILNHRASKMSTETATVETTKTVEQPEAVEQTSNAGSANVAGTMSKEQMMKIIIEQQKSIESQKEKDNTELDELRKLKAQIEKQKEEEKKRQAEKSYAMAETLVNQWSQTLDKEAMSESTKQTILDASKSHPEQMLEILRVAHCASKKHREQKEQFENYKSLMEKSALSAQFDQVMSKKKVIEQQPQRVASQPVVHAASNKKRKTMSDPEMFLKALSQYQSSGSALDHMNAVSKIGQRKQYNRPTYY